MLVLSVDTLRADALGCYGGSTPTPRVDAFAGESLVFDAAYTQASHTHPALTSMLTGLAPPHTGVFLQHHRLTERVVPLAVLLRAQGFATGSFVANLCKLQDQERTVFRAGWDEVFCAMDAGPEQHQWDEAAVAAGLEWIDAQEGPWFAWIHLMDPHAEHRPPPDLWEYEERPPGTKEEQYTRLGELEREHALPPADELERLHALYAAEVRGVDRLVGRVLDALDVLTGDEPPAIVFTADHGEELFETWPKHGHGYSLTEGVLRVPLIVNAPGVAPGRVDAPVELLQVAPTVLELTGVAAPYPLDGASLVATEPSRGTALSYAGNLVTLRRGDRRVWHTSALLPRLPELDESPSVVPFLPVAPWLRLPLLVARYAPEAPMQPVWLFPRDAAHEAEALDLRRALNDHLRGMQALPAVDTIEDPALRTQLEDLGYF